MRRTRNEAVENVKSIFLPAERSAESAAVNGARCIAAMIEERARARMPLETGADALEQIILATNLAIESRKHFLIAHRLLALLPEEMGVEVAYGPDECPPNSGTIAAVEVPGLRMVG